MNDPTSTGRDQPQSVIGPITLGVTHGGSIGLAPGSTLSLVQLGLSGVITVVRMSHAADTVTLDLAAHGALHIVGVGAGASVPLMAGAQLESIARTNTEVVIRLKAGGHEIAVPLAAGAGATVTVMSAAL